MNKNFKVNFFSKNKLKFQPKTKNCSVNVDVKCSVQRELFSM